MIKKELVNIIKETFKCDVKEATKRAETYVNMMLSVI